MFFESFLLNCVVLVALILALLYDYITKFFGYWYVRNIPYKTPIPCFGSDYLRIFGIQDTTTTVNKLYNQHPTEKYVGYIKGRIPDLIVRDLRTIQNILSADFAHFDNKGLCLDKSPDICIRNNLFYLEGEKWTLYREQIEANFKKISHRDLVCDKINEKYCEQNTGKVNINIFLENIMDKLLVDNVIEDDTVQLVKKNRELLQKRTFKNKVINYFKTIFPSIYTIFHMSTLPISFIIQARKKLCKLNYKTNSILQSMKVNNLMKAYSIYNDVDDTISTLSIIIGEAYTPCYYVIISILYELSKNIDCQAKARAAIELSAKSDSVTEKGNEDYLDRVIKEGIRVHPPYSIIHRRCMKGYKIPDSDIVIDKGVTVTIPVEALLKDNIYYENPDLFDPDRFLGEQKDSYSYIPFGDGPRKCPGAELAHKVIRGILSAILLRYQLEPCSLTPRRLVHADYNFQRVLAEDLWLNITPMEH